MFSHAQHRKCVASHSWLPCWWRHHLSPTHNLWLAATPGKQTMECTGSVATGQIEELKLLVSERLSAIASEIVTAIARTIAEYEAQAARLKEENDRHRSLLDVILKTSLPKKPPGGRPFL